MKISDYKGDAALDLLDSIIEPATEIIGDEKVSAMLKGKSNTLSIARYCLKNHRSAIIAIMAATEGVTADEYLAKCGVLTLPLKIVEILNDKELFEVFRSAERKTDET